MMSLTPMLDRFTEDEIMQLKRELRIRAEQFEPVMFHREVKDMIVNYIQQLYGYKIDDKSLYIKEFAKIIGVIAKKNTGLLNSVGSVRMPANPVEAEMYKNEVLVILNSLKERYEATEELRKKQIVYSGSEEDMD